MFITSLLILFFYFVLKTKEGKTLFFLVLGFMYYMIVFMEPVTKEYVLNSDYYFALSWLLGIPLKDMLVGAFAGFSTVGIHWISTHTKEEFMEKVFKRVY